MNTDLIGDIFMKLTLERANPKSTILKINYLILQKTTSKFNNFILQYQAL